MSFKVPDTPEELLRQSFRGLDQISHWFPVMIVVFVVGGILLSSFYSIEPDEVGVIRRFGQYVSTTEPGLHWKLPLNIDQLSKVKVKRIFKAEFGFRTVSAGQRSQYAEQPYRDESLMLTGDLNIIEVSWIVQFQVKDPVKFLFTIRNPIDTVRDVAEAVMRQIIGDASVTEALTTRRIEINLEAQKQMQAILDQYDSGIEIEVVKLQDVNPPDEVKPSFNSVNEAKQEKEKVINESWEAYNKVIPKAKGEAEKTIREAEGYALSRINAAKGDAVRFSAVWQAYQGSKDVTRRRLYLEAMGDALLKAGHIYLMPPGGQGVLPLLNLGEGKKL